MSGALVVYRYLCPYCRSGDMGPDTGRCLHCAGVGLTNDVGGWKKDELVEAPIPPGVMRKACLDCAYREGSPEQEDGGKCLPEDSPFWCHHGAAAGYFGSHQPIGAWRPPGHPRDIPLGELICAGWWAKATGRPLPTEPYRDLDKKTALTGVDESESGSPAVVHSGASPQASAPPRVDDPTSAGACPQHPTAPVIGGMCGGCTQYPTDMAKETDHA